MRDEVSVYVDWENIRLALADEFVEKVAAEEVMEAIQGVAKELGVPLAKATFYSDFTLRRDEARSIQSRARFEIRTVLRSSSQHDRSDPVIVADIMEQLYDQNSSERILICSADAGFCDIVRRCDSAGRRVYTTALSTQMSAELAGLAPFYPLEKYLPKRLTPRSASERNLTQPQLPPREYTRWSKLLGVLDSLEKRLPAVHLVYFQNTIMPAYRLGGNTPDDRYALLETAREKGLLAYYEVEGSRRPGRMVQAIRLSRDNEVVKEVLSKQ